MRKLILYIAMSLDGKIAGPDDDMSWLDRVPNPDQLDYGYTALQNEIGATIMGNGTYQWICRQPVPFPYTHTKNFVITRDDTLTDNGDVAYLSRNIPEVIGNMKAREGKHIWLIGGASVNRLCLEADLIDELRVFVMPVILGEVISLFGDGNSLKNLKLLSSKSYDTGVVELRYTT